MTEETKKALVNSGKVILAVALQAAVTQAVIEVQKYLNNQQQPVKQ